MLRSFKSEMRKLLRGPLVMGVAGSMAALTTLATFLVFATAEGGGTAEVPRGIDGSPEFAARSAAALAASSGLVEGVNLATLFIGVIAVVVVAWKVAGEFDKGTIRNLLTRQPNRVRLLGGKLLALWVFVAAAAMAAVVVSIGSAILVGPIYAVDTSAWFTTSGAEAVASTTADLVIAVVGYAAIGALLGIVMRSAAPAIGIALAWLLPVESLLARFTDTAGDWLPGQVFSDLAAGGPELGYTRALTVTLGYAAVAIIASLALFKWRDVTA